MSLSSQSPQGMTPVASLYTMKALLAFFVVTCHAPMSLPWVQIPGLVTELFLTITGYFLYKGDLEQTQRAIKASIWKVLPILLVLQALYYPLAPIDWSSPIVVLNWIIQGIGNFDAVHLWYLTALLYSLIAFGLYLWLFKGRYIPVLFIPVLGWMVLGNYRYFIDGGEDSVYIFNFLSRGLPFLAMGYWIRQHEEALLKKSWWNIYFALLTLAGCEGLLAWSLSDGHTMGGLIQVFPLRLAIFMLFLSYKSLGEGTWLETIGKKYSGNIYYFHMAVIWLWKGLNASSPTLSTIYEQGGALVVFFLSLGIAYLVVKLQDRLGYHLFR